MQVLDDSALRVRDGCHVELDQALRLLAASGVEHPEALTLGAGDRLLLALASAAGELAVIVTCPSCAMASRVALRPEAMPPQDRRSAWRGPGGGLREPTYADLAGLPDGGPEAGAELLRRCTVGSPTRRPTAEDMDLVDTTLGPLAMDCPGCASPIEVPIDVQRLALEALARRAEQVDREVHVLAATYHWDLATIEGLADGRRQRLAALAGETR